MTDFAHGGRITAIPNEDDRLELTVSSEIGDAEVKLTPAEAAALGAGIMAWGMAQPWRAFGAACRRVMDSMAEAAERSEP